MDQNLICSFNEIHKISNLLGIKHKTNVTFEGCISAGDSPVSNYGYGILYLKAKLHKDNSCIIVTVSSIDDSEVDIWGPVKPLDKLQVDFENLFKDLQNLRIFNWNSFKQTLDKYHINSEVW